MRNLDLGSYGVSEMTSKEMEEVEGGMSDNWKMIIKAAIIIGLICLL